MRFTFLIIFFITINIQAKEIDTSFVMGRVVLAHQIQDEYPDSAYTIAKEVLAYSSERDYDEGMAYAYLRMGHLMNVSGKNDSALHFAMQAYQLRKAREDYKGAIGAAFTLSYIYNELGQSDSAFSILYQAIELEKSISDSLTLAQLHLELGQLLREYENHDAAIESIEKAKTFNSTIKDKYLSIQIYDALGSVYYASNQNLKALDEYLKANQLLSEDEFSTSLMLNLNNLANCYTRLDNHEKAKRIYLLIIRELRASKRYPDLSLAYFNIGMLYSNNENCDSAIYYYNKSYNIAYMNDDVYRQAACEHQKAKCFHELGNHESAYIHHYRFKELSDSLLNIDKLSLIEELNTKYQTRLKEQEIELLDKENKTKTAQRNALVIGIFLLMILASAIIFFFSQKNKISKQKQQIAQQKLDSVLDEQEIKTYNAMIEGQEEERQRIASDLHDRLGSMLSTIKLLFSSLEEKIVNVQNENKTQYEKATNLIDEACVEVRRISHNLSSGLVANYGLVKALEDLCETINHSSKVECKLLTYNMEEGLPLRFEVELYRIAQEVLNNALKHADANTITIQLGRLEDEMSMTIEDDGKGFEVDKTKGKEGMGLDSMRKRAEKLNGNLYIDSDIDKGTITIVEIPLNRT